MTKKIGLLLLIGLAFLACKDDEAVFDVPVPEDGLRFEAVNGGAIMHYTIPENSAICAICARYVNCWGEEVLVKASPYVDTLSLPGFHAPMKDVPVSVFVTDNNDVPSPAVQRTFSTLASAPYSFMDSVEVVSSWDGVRIQSSYTGEVEGIVDVYHVGISPTTQQTDTLFIKNFAIAEGRCVVMHDAPSFFR